MNTTLLNTIRTSRGFSRTVSYLFIVALAGLALERIIYYSLERADIIERENVVEKINRIAPYKARLLGLPKTPTKRQIQNGKSNDTKLSEAVVSIQDTLDVLAYELINKGDLNKAQDKLSQLNHNLQEYDQQAIIDFDKTAAHIKQYQLAEVIQQRHTDMVANYRGEMDALLAHLNTIQGTTDTDDKLDAVLAARKQLEGKQLKRSQQPFDPNNLPFKSVQPNKNNKPRVSAEEFAAAGLFNNPNTQYAALGDFTYDKLPGANNPAYLAETDEVIISPAIRAQAQLLSYDPVQIYHWVHNNIEWLPSWGAMQDSDVTLGSLKGNALDIASLTIALLRASQIPARYVHGTVEVPVEKYRNWVGNFTSVEAAGDFASSGGIPTTAIIRDGKVNSIRMEHVWVEAATDYAPSRGAVNRDADSWVAFDTSYKQYDYLPGLDMASITNLDGQTIVDNYINSGTVNEMDSWVSGFDQGILQNAQNQARTALENYINTNMTNATVGDVIGGSKILVRNDPGLPSSLPNKIVTTGARYGSLPSTLQPTLQVALGKDILGQPLDSIILPWSKVNNHKLTLSYKPATPDDEAALKSLLPKGQITDINQLPGSIPAYLIKVVPELKLDATVVSVGNPMALGEELDLNFTLRSPSYGSRSYSSPVIAGSYQTLTSLAGSVSSSILAQTQTSITTTKAKLLRGDPIELQNIDRESLLGDMFYAGSLGYFAQFTALTYVAGLQNKVRQGLLPSIGTYGYVPKVSYFFGFPRAIKPGGVEMDLDAITTFTTSLDGDSRNGIGFVQQTGVLSSALEHAVPEQMFVSQSNPGEAASAVKALSKANLAGQRIYHITNANRDTALLNINHNSIIMSEINRALDLGKEIITHTDEVNISSWRGVGYIILDPESGAGAFKISRGINGGEYEDDFWSRYLDFINQYLIELDLTSIAGLILFGSIPKSWVGALPLLGSTNPLTSVLRGVLNSPLGKLILFRTIIIPLFTLTFMFIGFFNVTILIQGFFYASLNIYNNFKRRIYFS